MSFCSVTRRFRRLGKLDHDGRGRGIVRKDRRLGPQHPGHSTDMHTDRHQQRRNPARRLGPVVAGDEATGPACGAAGVGDGCPRLPTLCRLSRNALRRRISHVEPRLLTGHAVYLGSPAGCLRGGLQVHRRLVAAQRIAGQPAKTSFTSPCTRAKAASAPATTRSSSGPVRLTPSSAAVKVFQCKPRPSGAAAR